MVILSSEVTKATLSGSFGRREHSSGLRYSTPVSLSRRMNSFEIWLSGSRWSYHRLRDKHVNVYANEFVFPFEQTMTLPEA
jgi:hypothetical protein